MTPRPATRSRAGRILAGAMLLGLALPHDAPAATPPAAPGTCGRLVIIDVGHSPAAPGATSAGGTPEYDFNWRLARDLAARLKDAGWKSRFLVQPGENISLAARADRISRLRDGVLLSLHHDSVQPRYLVRRAKAGAGGPLSLHARGYSLFVKTDAARVTDSIALARAIGTQLSRIPIKPNPSHAEHIAGENRPWVDAKLGIYAYNGLSVLRASRIPAVLIEAAVIVNPLDEAWISRKENRRLFTAAVTTALESGCPETVTGSKATP